MSTRLECGCQLDDLGVVLRFCAEHEQSTPRIDHSEERPPFDMLADDKVFDFKTSCSLCGAPDTRECDCSRPQSVTITIETTGAAFGKTDADMTSEVARILRWAATRMQEGTVADRDGAPVLDANGNTCGRTEVHTGTPLPLPDDGQARFYAHSWAVEGEPDRWVIYDRLKRLGYDGEVLGKYMPQDVALHLTAQLNALDREPTAGKLPRPTIDNVVSYLALMQGGAGLLSKSPTYLAEKTRRLIEDEPQILDSTRQQLADEWRARWAI